MRPARRPASRSPAGFTLIELAVGLAVALALVAIAVPSMTTYIQRKRVEGVASEFVSNVRYTRSLSQAGIDTQNSITDLNLSSDGVSSCYTINVPINAFRTVCDCLRTPMCTMLGTTDDDTKLLKHVKLPAAESVQLRPTDRTRRSVRLRFAPHTGLPDNGATISVDVVSSRGGTLRIVTSPTGLPSICNVEGHAAYPSC